MLPKLAANLLHASRATYGQAVNFRNVLQFQTSFPPPASAPTSAGSFGASSSGWGSSAGTGGANAKYHAGSRFYSGYAGSGSVIAHANSSTAHQAEDKDDHAATPASSRLARRPTLSLNTRPTRRRSSSFSLDSQGRDERGQELGVLSAVQSHVRNRHAFAQSARTETNEDASSLLSSNPRPQPSVDETTPRVLTRRNSTASIHSDTPADLPPYMTPSPQQSSQVAQVSPTPAEDGIAQGSPEDVAAWEALNRASASGNWDVVIAEVQKFRANPRQSVPCYNIAMDAVLRNRAPGQPITLILELYNEMITLSLLPNVRTYRTVIEALCDRDQEVHRVLVSLDARTERRAVAHQDRTPFQLTDTGRMEKLRSEGNFESAIALFDAAVASGAFPLTTRIYNSLLRSCSYRGDLDAALRIFSRLEQERGAKPDSASFSYLIRCNAAVKDVDAAAEVFKSFLVASENDDISWRTNGGSDGTSALRAQGHIWNTMLEAYMQCGQPERAMDLLEKMMDSPSTSFGPTSIPKPSPSTYTVIITEFLKSGDVQSALSWFNRLLDQGTYVADAYLPVSQVPLPDFVAWNETITALAKNNALEDLNRLYPRLLATIAEHGLEFPSLLQSIVVDANLRFLYDADLADPHTASRLDFLLQLIPNERWTPVRALMAQFVETLARFGRANDAARVTVNYIKMDLERIQTSHMPPHLVSGQVRLNSQTLNRCVHAIFGTSHRLSLQSAAIDLPTAFKLVELEQDRMTRRILIRSYQNATLTNGSPLELAATEWPMLVESYTVVALSQPDEGELDFESLINGLAAVQDRSLVANVEVSRLAQALLASYPYDKAKSLLESFDPSAVLASSPAPTTSSLGFDSVENSSNRSVSSADTDPAAHQHVVPAIKIDIPHSRFVDEHQYTNTGVTPLIAFKRLQAGIENGVYPSPETLGRLLNSLGRQGELEKVQIVYHAAQVVLNNLEHDKHWQSSGWFQVEDHMIIAYAHAGDLDTAGIHRVRVIENGGVPSADAYGALISCVRDTTDDASIARELFEESQRLGVRANIFLYNTIISKLSRARKADYALELFQRMRDSGLRPTSVTYGAVIGACCRVGDEDSAVILFDEMVSMPNFKPRVPPYNTMIQFFTQTKPNRERALHYYTAMLAAGVSPSAHTYKLLIDMYGAVEPVDMESAQATFDQLIADRSVAVQGTHWAALINAWGCVSRDLHRAITVFESISTHPSTMRSKVPLPDAVVYESLINVCVTLHRMDLVPAYIQRLQDSNIHVTAYIMNLLIKGYAAAGDMEKARETFASLQDPEMGVAAPNNHVSHDGTLSPSSASGVVYREPSTWEAMVRAELGAGERQRANELLDRMETRMFPPAVTTRIRGIVRDESIPL